MLRHECRWQRQLLSALSLRSRAHKVGVICSVCFAIPFNNTTMHYRALTHGDGEYDVMRDSGEIKKHLVRSWKRKCSMRS